MAESDIATVRMPVQHTLRHAPHLGANMARGQADAHRRRAQRAEERKRRGSKLLLGKPSAHPVGRVHLASDAIRLRSVLVRQLSHTDRRRHYGAMLTWDLRF